MSIILPGLKTSWLGKNCLYLDETGSTNEYLKSRAGDLPGGTAVIAGRQTAGKGRIGRIWQTGEDSLSMSFLLREVDTSYLPPLPLAVGCAVLESLEALGVPGLSLKWSNDVLCEGKKLCGILCESRVLGNRAFAVVGVGVNMTQSRADFDDLGLVYATSVKLATGKNIGIFELAAGILSEFEPIFEKLRESGFKAIRSEYLEKCVTIGREARVVLDGREQVCKAAGIDTDGGLICEKDGRTFIVRAGEASVRGIYGYI